MNRYGYDEERVIEEVLYLHSLWHQGPPPPPPNPIPIPIPIPIPEPYIPQPFFSAHAHLHPHHHHHHHQHQHPFAPAHTRSLPPTTSTSNKRKKNKNHKRRRKDPIPQPDPGPEWPCQVSPDPPESGWAEFKPCSSAASLSVSPQEKERLSALQAQNKASQALRNFLIDSDDDDDEDDDYDYDGLEEIEEFVVGIFMEDDEMRGYYQRCFENGEFCCLVCDAIGKKKSGKRYKDCVALVQHSMSISRTVKKLAHRAFGQAVCKVLGWDIDRLPTIVMKGVPLGINNADAAEGEPKQNAEDDGDARDGKLVEYARGVDQGIGECSSKVGDVNKSVENLDEKMLENRGGGAIDEVCNEPLVSGAEWVCTDLNCDSSSTASGWPSFNTESSSLTCAVSTEAQPTVAVLQMQHKALEACGEYLVGNAGSDCDGDNDDEDEDELIDYSDPVECEEFKFFLRVFTEDSDLRRYYENHYREGDFYCLVCGGLGKKIWKRFKGCIALLQHSTAIKRTKRKRAHRAYSQVICKVLGWDIDRLPAIVLKGESLGSSLAGSRKLSGETEKPVDSRINDSNGKPENPADAHIDDSNVLQEN